MRKKGSLVLTIMLVFMSCINIVNAFEVKMSVTDFSYGVSARPTAKSTYIKMKEEDEKDSLVMATNKGLYIIKESSSLFINTNREVYDYLVIDDINNDGVKDIVYAINNSNLLSNLTLVSGDTGEVLWTDNISKRDFNYNSGWLNKNVTIYKLVDLNGKIGVIYEYSIAIYNSKTGKISYTYTDKDNIWDAVSISDNKLAVSNQIGQVKLIDIDKKKVIWTNKVIKDFTITEKNKKLDTVTRNVWQIIYKDGYIYSIDDSGALNKINPKDGNIEGTLSVYDISDDVMNNIYKSNTMGWYGNSYSPIGKNSQYFKAFEMFDIKEETLLVSSFVNYNQPNNMYGPDMSDSNVFESKYTMIDLNNFNVLYDIIQTKDSLKNVKPGLHTISSKDYIVLPTSIMNNKMITNLINIEDGEIFKTYELSLEGQIDSNAVYVVNNNDNIHLDITGISSNLYNNKLEKIKSFNTYKEASSLLRTDEYLVVAYYNNDNLTKVAKYDIKDSDKKVWEYDIPKTPTNDGLISGITLYDMNKDSVPDLVGLVNQKNSKGDIIASYILTLDLKDGKQLGFNKVFSHYEYDQWNNRYDAYIIGSEISVISDVTGDSKRDFIIGSSVINSSNYKIVKTYDTSAISGKWLIVGDINKDGISDIVGVEDKVATLYTSKITWDMISYTKTNNKYTYSQDLDNISGAQIIGDINKDGIKDIVFNAKGNAGRYYYQILSGSDLKKIVSISETEGIDYSFREYMVMNFDINNEGTNNICEIVYNGQQYRFLSGKTGEVLFEVGKGYGKDMAIDYPMSMNIISSTTSVLLGTDHNNDTHNELYVLMQNEDDNYGYYLNIYDIYNKKKKPIKEIKLFSNEYAYAYQENITYDYSYENEDYSFKISKVENTLQNLISIKIPSGKTQIYDVDNEEVIAIFNKPAYFTRMIDDKRALMTGKDDAIYIINLSNELRIENLKNNQKISSKINLKWTYEEYGGMNTISVYDNGILLGKTEKNSMKLSLIKGKHTLTIESEDTWGKILSTSINVTVEKSNAIRYIMLITLGIFITGIVFLVIGPKMKRKRAVRRLS